MDKIFYIYIILILILFTMFYYLYTEKNIKENFELRQIDEEFSNLVINFKKKKNIN